MFGAFKSLFGKTYTSYGRKRFEVSSFIHISLTLFDYRIAVDPIFPPPPVPVSKRHSIPDAQDNKFELIFNEREDAAELKNLPIDDNMNGIIEEEEMEEEGSDIEEEEVEQE